MNKFLEQLHLRFRQVRFQPRMAWARFHLATTDFATGLGPSASLLYGLARSLKPDTCVEIGSATGWSACHIGMALRENVQGRLYAIDPHRTTNWNDPVAADTLPILQCNLHRCGLEKYVEIVQATSAEAARDCTRPIDLLFIDGDHSFEGVKRDWDLFSPHLSAYGVAVFHDATWDLHGTGRPDMGVPRFLETLRQQGYPLITIDRDYGLTLVQACRHGRPLTPQPPAAG